MTASAPNWRGGRCTEKAFAQIADSLLPQLNGQCVPIGLGLDIVEVAEFERLPFESNRNFYERCFSAGEIAYCRSRAAPAQHFAARFAAKEAAVKAFSQVAQLAYWQIEVERTQDGAPALRLSDVGRQGPWRGARSYTTLVSLSHTDRLAAAAVVAYRKEVTGAQFDR